MKYFKGCLLTLILFIITLVIVYFLFKHNVLNNLEHLNNNAESNWNIYTENLKKRNTELSQQNFKNDSLKYFWNKAKSISTTKCSKELEYNEYKINQFTMSANLISNLNDKINLSLDNYNQAVREYNQYRVRFPNVIIAKKTNFPKDFNFFVYRYGIDNEKEMIRQKKIDNWIENGGELIE